MTYDKLNRMLRHEGPSGVEVFAYRGAEWHRFSQATAAGGKQFLYDGDNVLADIASGVDAFYVTPFLDQNLSITTGGSTYYYSQDGLGSVRTLTDSTGAVKNSYDYLPFGGGYQPGTNVAVEQRYTYTGREKNPESALMYYRYRTYDPRVGRFGGRDLGRRGDENLYIYVLSRSISHADPFGLRIAEWDVSVDPPKIKDITPRLGLVRAEPPFSEVRVEGTCHQCENGCYGLEFRFKIKFMIFLDDGLMANCGPGQFAAVLLHELYHVYADMVAIEAERQRLKRIQEIVGCSFTDKYKDDCDILAQQNAWLSTENIRKEFREQQSNDDFPAWWPGAMDALDEAIDEMMGYEDPLDQLLED
jgi:RHS repeat-associated protein